MTPLQTIQKLYASFGARDFHAFRELCSPSIQWVQNSGFPGGATYEGADAIIEGVFERNDALESGPDGLIVHTKSGRSIAADLIIEATGRVANVSVLAGDHGGVEHSARGIVVDEFMRSVSNPNVYAIGDCIEGSRMLATTPRKSSTSSPSPSNTASKPPTSPSSCGRTRPTRRI